MELLLKELTLGYQSGPGVPTTSVPTAPTYTVPEATPLTPQDLNAYFENHKLKLSLLGLLQF